MRVVVALGGNALSPRGRRLTVASQREAVARAAAPLADVAREHELVVTHGNGPQVGLLALQAAALDRDNDFTLDVLDAESAGLVGHLLELALTNELPADRDVVTLLTRTLVDHADPAFDHPTKFVGPGYGPDAADRLRVEHGWDFALDGGTLRRVVPSPVPVQVLPVTPVEVLLGLGCVVVCGGGGGVPVTARDGRLESIEAVVDKDAVSALLAADLGADLFVVATDVDGVYSDFGAPTQRRHAVLDLVEHPLERYPAGSMGPKVAAAARFSRTGGRAVIGSLEQLPGLVSGQAGTRVLDSRRAPGLVGAP